ncbi:ArsC family reductase [Noviherbaspirillum sp. CPCC 100848]|uniref:ArsC family reductase n=1 Tax=Noviherbaspirillum album TaxID=3080276 RepID=A0ABU6J759_9BURK|nr:ArsC family reductase [Noviherbaspirillum sp. CPCC 100848]MEC4719469.1 ArsC family reductase [Noviherbaspirillum sp. CPCC 100848]
MAITLYGIPNCDTVKKARTWLTEHGIAHAFHDFKKAGLSPDTVESWLGHVQWDTLVNRKGTTWRGLPDERKAAIVDAASATALMLESPSVIKRPVLVDGSSAHVGFSDAAYRQIFGK